MVCHDMISILQKYSDVCVQNTAKGQGGSKVPVRKQRGQAGQAGQWDVLLQPCVHISSRDPLCSTHFLPLLSQLLPVSSLPVELLFIL